MLIWTPSKPILFASSTASGLPSSLRFQSVTPTLNLTPLRAAYASRRSRGQRAAAATPLPRIRRLSRRVRLMNRLLVERWFILGQAGAGHAARSADGDAPTGGGGSPPACGTDRSGPGTRRHPSGGRRRPRRARDT